MNEAQALMACYRFLSELLTPLVEEFERKAYLDGGLGAYLDKATQRGLSGKLNDIDILTYTIAGRVCIQFGWYDESVSVMAAAGENPPRMGLHVVDGNVMTAWRLLREVIDRWESPDILQPDANTRLL